MEQDHASIDTGHAQQLTNALVDRIHAHSFLALMHWNFDRERTESNRAGYVAALAAYEKHDARVYVLEH